MECAVRNILEKGSATLVSVKGETVAAYKIPGHWKNTNITCHVCGNDCFTLDGDNAEWWALQCDACSAILLFKECPDKIEEVQEWESNGL